MVRRKHSGMVWRPIEYVLFAIVVILIGSLLWMNHVIRREISYEQQQPGSVGADDTDISNIVEQNIEAEQRIDSEYVKWEEQSNAAVDSAADDLGGAIDESSY